MYEAVRQRAQISSKAAGVMTMVLVTAAAGYVMANGFGANVVEALERVTTIATLPPVEKTVEQPEKLALDTNVDVPLPPVPPMPIETFQPPDKPPYPPAAIRSKWEGVSELTACVDAKGRVTSVSVAKTSGHEVLDDAATEMGPRREIHAGHNRW